MQPRIENLASKKLLGKSITMSFANNKTFDLWQSFIPRKNEIKNAVNTNLYSVEIYSPEFYANFDPTREFQKWAAVEVPDFSCVPAGMQTLVIPEGWYAVFIHKGPAGECEKTYRYIFTEWLPHSAYVLDQRPHFALMGEKYKREDYASEEEIWIPVVSS